MLRGSRAGLCVDPTSRIEATRTITATPASFSALQAATLTTRRLGPQGRESQGDAAARLTVRFIQTRTLGAFGPVLVAAWIQLATLVLAAPARETTLGMLTRPPFDGSTRHSPPRSRASDQDAVDLVQGCELFVASSVSDAAGSVIAHRVSRPSLASWGFPALHACVVLFTPLHGSQQCTIGLMTRVSLWICDVGHGQVAKLRAHST